MQSSFLKPCGNMVCNHIVIQFLEHKVAVSGNSLIRQIDYGTVAAVIVIAFRELKGSVADRLSETCGHNIFRPVVNVIPKIDCNGNTRLQQFLILL